MFKSIWAEDGWMPLCVVARGHGSCLTDQVNGYWPILHRLFSEVIAFLPLNLWPFTFPVLAALMLGAICSFIFLIFRSVSSAPAGTVIGLGVVLIPSLGIEFINVVGNVHWLALMAAVIALVACRESQSLRWQSLSGLVFVASIANPAGLLLFVQIVIFHLTGLGQGRKWRVLACISLFGWMVQLTAILLFGGAGRAGTTSTVLEKVEAWANSLLGVVPGLRVSEVSEEAFSRPASWLTPIAVLILVMGILAFFIVSTRATRAQRQFAALGVSTQGLTAFLLFALEEDPRYEFVIIALNLVWMTGLVLSVSKVRITVPVLAAILLVLPLPALKAGSYRVVHSEQDWNDQLSHASELCRVGMKEIEIYFAPGKTYVTKVKCAEPFIGG